MGETGEPVAVISGRHKKKLLSRADAMLEAGDLGGYTVWRGILKAVEELSQDEPVEGERVN